MRQASGVMLRGKPVDAMGLQHALQAVHAIVHHNTGNFGGTTCLSTARDMFQSHPYSRVGVQHAEQT